RALTLDDGGRLFGGSNSQRPRAAAFSPDGNRVVVGFSGDMVGVWDAAAGGAPVQTLRGFGGEVAALAFSPDGKRLATGGDRYIAGGDRGAVGLWDLETGQELRRLPGHAARVTSVAFAKTGARIVAAGDGRPVATTDRLRGYVAGAAFAPDGKGVYVGTTLNNLNSAERGEKDTLLSMVHRWDLATGKAVRFLKDQDAGVGQMVLSPDGKRL